MNQYEKLIPKELLKDYESAPAHVRELIQSGKLVSVVGAIHKKHALHIDVTSKMMTELFKALLGVTKWESLYTAFVDRAGVPVQIIQEVLRELDREVFIPLQDKLRSEKTPAKTPETPPPASTAPKVMPTIKGTAPTSTPPSVGTLPSTALETLPPHEITVRTMKNDAVSVKAGEKPSRFVLPKREPEQETKKSSPISKYLKPLGASSPAFADTAPKEAFVSRFTAPAKKDEAPVAPKSTLPPQTFLPIKQKDPVMSVSPQVAPHNTGSSFIPKVAVVAPPKVVVSAPVPTGSSVPTSTPPLSTPLPKPSLQVPVPPPMKSSEPPKKASQAIDPYREIPE